jgi:hypothetical protein
MLITWGLDKRIDPAHYNDCTEDLGVGDLGDRSFIMGFDWMERQICAGTPKRTKIACPKIQQ